MSKRCQSCGIPLHKDPAGGGSEADGTRSTTYCSYCFSNGKFIHPDFNVEQMQQLCIEQLNKRGMPRFMGWIFTRELPRLERWKS